MNQWTHLPTMVCARSWLGVSISLVAPGNPSIAAASPLWDGHVQLVAPGPKSLMSLAPIIAINEGWLTWKHRHLPGEHLDLWWSFHTILGLVGGGWGLCHHLWIMLVALWLPPWAIDGWGKRHPEVVGPVCESKCPHVVLWCSVAHLL